ncbi:M14 family metallopeptidase [Blastopirellula sp. J2-11]|uniref:M14 family metallopeptidase n=1 Tax=Blastopirellula sp. J2-11 TaxID=2943192 RepID=UPI0021C89388|nr:M14 family metallopeptidase [Blastopirellula sp. J2-11]UUO05763.1 M14 family metallopeptidase [Blastopirellula sp. J2-11]
MSVQEGIWFPRDYDQSRSEFLAVGKELGGEWESHAIESLGPQREPLTIDLLTLGDLQSPHCLVLSSGLHGLEAPLGAAIQQRWMRLCLREGGPPNLRIVLAHALNPFGFACQRRSDAENLDLNRAFLRRGEEHRGAPPLYKTLDPLLNPEAPPSGCDFFRLRAAATLARYGMKRVKQAIAGGQYEYPRGLFYGGKGPSEAQQILTPHWKAWLGASRRVIHLDFHTGLGRWGEMTLLAHPQLNSPWQQQAAQALGGPGVDRHREDAGAYEARGDFGLWCAEQAGEIDYAYFCTEFGTYSAVSVLHALRRENQAHFWGDRASPAYRHAKQSAADAFCPKSAAWRERTVLRGEAACLAAVAKLQENRLD